MKSLLLILSIIGMGLLLANDSVKEEAEGEWIKAVMEHKG